MNKSMLLLAVVGLGLGLSGCQPRTPAEKAKDKVEDAAHETDQGLKRAGDRVNDSVK
jgi:hypothetical protein